MPVATVLDSYALLAFLRGEAGDDKVATLLEKAGERNTPLHMTEVNYAEVKCIIICKDGMERWEAVARELPTLPLEFHPATRVLADLAADYKARHKLSLANAFSVALAKDKKAELVTGDPEFKAVEVEIKIQWIC